MKKTITYNNDLLRSKNRGKVFEQLVTNDGVYRMDLVETCGLTKMSISNIVNEFLEKDIIVETVKNEEVRPGRKSTLLRLSPGAKKIIGLLIHRRYMAAVLCDCQLKVIRLKTLQYSEITKDVLLDNAISLIDEMFVGEDIFGIGVGSIGPVDWNRGVVLNPPDFYGIENIPIAQFLKEKYGCPVYLDYHYNCVARAEKYYGKGKGYKNFLLLGVDEMAMGISAVVDGKILTGMLGISSEIGHLTVDYNGIESQNGRRGGLGYYISYDTPEKTWQTVQILTSALLGICDLLVPEALIIRDENKRLNEEQLDYIRQELNQKIVANKYHKIGVFRSTRSQELEVCSCAANVLGRIFGGEIEI